MVLVKGQIYIPWMNGERLKVRLAYQRGFQIVDSGAVLAAFENHVEAFKFVRNRGARVWLDWSRTVIGGQSVPYDFTASFLQSSIGRISKNQWGSLSGTWSWSISTSDPRFRLHGGQRGTAATRDEAVFQLEREFTRFIAETEKYRR
ncbi:hypothetical protein L2449_29265 [Mesorhizobium muleiense]|uniref:hypothetical protein n=1 Tax=Mesorhizobium muleiense TaxID=1004279 RepID=UPI001F2F61AF|nr:hypothetical protein [Mesorhizobium muleiense]MCF6120920.1 hypothetical protein [Mesorhizobium muleiense]